MPCSLPIWPIRKSDGQWRLRVDYQKLDSITPPLAAACPSTSEILIKVQKNQDMKFMAIVDVSDMFSFKEDSGEQQDQFAFTVKDSHYTLTVLP